MLLHDWLDDVLYQRWGATPILAGKHIAEFATPYVMGLYSFPVHPLCTHWIDSFGLNAISVVCVAPPGIWTLECSLWVRGNTRLIVVYGVFVVHVFACAAMAVCSPTSASAFLTTCKMT